MLEDPSAHQAPRARPGPLFALVAALLLSTVGTWELSEVPEYYQVSHRPPNPVNHSDLGAFRKPGKQGTEVCNGFLFTFFFLSGAF